MLSIHPYVEATASRQYHQALPRIQLEQIAKVPWGSRSDNFGVAGNTFRAYTGWQGSPSKLFRGWAERHATPVLLGTAPESISSQAAFDRCHHELAESLQRAWEAAEGARLSVAHKYKLIDLYVKWLTQHRLPNPKLCIQLVQFGHCPLDRQTLVKLNVHLSGALPITMPTMGIIATEATYSLCQAVIREYCSIAGGTPVLFDYFAWQRGG